MTKRPQEAKEVPTETTKPETKAPKVNALGEELREPRVVGKNELGQDLIED